MTTACAPAVLSSLLDLEPVHLDELNAEAALQTRVDRKYVLGLDDAEQVVAALARSALALEIDGQRTFGYASLYYDTPDLTSYRLSAHGRRRRFKVRRRTYLDSGQSFVEVKTRGTRGTTVKERTPFDGGVLVGAARSFVDDALDRAGVDAVRCSDLEPSLHTRYRRSTLYLPATGSRVTVDTGLSWRLPDGERLDLPGTAVVETKSGAAASAADRLLWSRGHRPSRISKYATGLAAFRDDLPANRWQPVMRRHFPSTPPAASGRPSHSEDLR